MKAITTTTTTDTMTMAIAIHDEATMKYVRKARAANTVRAYRAAWAEFQGFADSRGQPRLPATSATVIDYLTALADGGAKVNTIGVKLAAIASAHRTAKLADPTVDHDVRLVMAGIRRTLGVAPQKKAPIMRDELMRMVGALPDTLAGRRDRALLLVGYFGAFRRSELVALDANDLRINGMMQIVIRRSKTDQEAEGQVKTFPRLGDTAICPVAALQAWLDAAKIKSGPVFRRIDRWGHAHDRMTSQSVALVVKALAKRAGLDYRALSGHSLRSGFVTQAYIDNARTFDIMDQTGHKSEHTLRGYAHLAGRGASAAVRAAAGVNVVE